MIRRFFKNIHRLIVNYVEMRVIELQEIGKPTQALTLLYSAVVWNFITSDEADAIKQRRNL